MVIIPNNKFDFSILLLSMFPIPIQGKTAHEAQSPGYFILEKRSISFLPEGKFGIAIVIFCYITFTWENV